MTTRNNPTNWLAIIQGNTHQRRGWFQGSRLISQEILPSGSTVEWSGEIWGLSVAGTLPGRRITTADIPLQDMYPGLGADRALGLWAALHLWGSPVLLVDAGTALTFTAGVEGRFVGGAILAGWQSQAKALHELTQSLPLATPRDPIPSRWARDTLSAIDSGLTYGLRAVVQDFIQAWRQLYPHSQVVITGGDGERLGRGLGRLCPDLLLEGISLFRAQQIANLR